MITDLHPIELAYANSERQVVLDLAVIPGTTIKDAIEQSGILTLFPEINLATATVGIFSAPKNLMHQVSAGDRIEIYRDTYFDPRIVRRSNLQ